MKKYILPFMSIAMLMAMASCSSSDDAVEEIKEESKLVPMTFTATQESNAETRSALNGSNGVDWQTNDKISVFDGTGAENNQEFTLTGDVKDGKFSGNASATATKFTAVYPYTDGAQLESDGSVSGIELPAEQTATPNSFDPKAALMMAYSTDKSKLDFKNAVSLVKVTTQFACKKIVLSANEDIAGTGTLTMTFDNVNDTYTSSFTFSAGNSRTITLKPASENGVIAAGTYYIAIRPHTSSGFSIRFINSADTKAYTQTSIKSNTFNRSKIKDLSTFTESGKWTSTIESNGNVKASQQVDMGVFTIGDKNYRVIFATSNLTQDGLAENEYDYGDYFAWGATEPLYKSYTIENGKATVLNNDWLKTGGYIEANAPTLDNKYTSEKDFEMSDDPARKILGDAWQLPTKEIWVALYNANKNKVYWGPDGNKGLETISGIQGMKITRKDDSNTHLFLPAAGYFSGTGYLYVGRGGYYWSGTAYLSTKAYFLEFDYRPYVLEQSKSLRYLGRPVRPVRLVAVD